jgi:hypothetical protein
MPYGPFARGFKVAKAWSSWSFQAYTTASLASFFRATLLLAANFDRPKRNSFASRRHPDLLPSMPEARQLLTEPAVVSSLHRGYKKCLLRFHHRLARRTLDYPIVSLFSGMKLTHEEKRNSYRFDPEGNDC